jgi:hypothetical protein
MNLSVYEIFNLKNILVGEALEYEDGVAVVKYYDYKFPTIYNNLDILIDDLGAEHYLIKSKLIIVNK